MRGVTILLGVSLMVLPAMGQSVSPLASLHEEVSRVSNPMDLPDAPSALGAEPISPVERDRETTELLADDPYHPLTRQQKWHHFLHRTYASATFAGAAEDTLFTKATGGFIYCCGVGSWGEQYAASLANTEARQFFGNFLFPTLLKQDPRYFPKRRGGIAGRAWYAVTRVVVTRNDSGRNTFNSSEVLGVAFSKALCNAYYPDRQRGMWDTGANILGTFQSDATSNLLREFWPDIRRIVHKHTPRRFQSLENRLTLPNTSWQY